MGIKNFTQVPRDIREWGRFFREATVQADSLDDGIVTTDKIVDDAVTDAKLRNSAALSVIGRPVNSVGDPSDLVAAVDGYVLRRSGATVGFGTINSTSIGDFQEASEDVTAALINDGTGITWVYDDVTNTLTGTVSLAPFSTTDLAEGSNLYFTDERAQDAVGSALASSATVTLTYVDATPSITAALVADSVADSFLANMAQSRIKGRAEGAGTGDPTDLTPTQVAAIIDGEAINWAAQQTFSLAGSVNTPTILMTSTQPVLGWYEDDQAANEKKWVIAPVAKVLQFRSSEDAASTSIIWGAITRGTGTAITNIALGDTTNNNTYTFGSTGTAAFSGAISTTRIVVTGSTVPTNGMYLSASNELSWATNSAKQLTLTSDGRLYGISLHNNAGAVTGTTNQHVASGTYTPTLTGVANVAASTAYACQWIRVGNVVTVSGKVDVDPTLTVTATQLGISLPIASNLANAEDCAGTAAAPGIAGQCAAILGDAANNRAEMNWMASDVTNQAMYFSFTYEVL